eukprot:7716541-Alexandrium_andersonii.AAC.1
MHARAPARAHVRIHMHAHTHALVRMRGHARACAGAHTRAGAHISIVVSAQAVFDEALLGRPVAGFAPTREAIHISMPGCEQRSLADSGPVALLA